jgi:hypothetical protein
MARTPHLDDDQLDRVLGSQKKVITRDQALACGLTTSAIEYRLRIGGAWQWLLPSIYMAETGTVTPGQRAVAAQLYGGRQALISGPVAVRWHALTCAGPDVIDVLIPSRTRLRSTEFVRVHRTRHMPRSYYRTGLVRFTEPARAVADAARFSTRFNDVRAVVSDALLRGKCTLDELSEELAIGGLARSALFRRALEEVDDGVRSVAEADFRVLIQRSRLPEPVFNAQLYDASGRFIAMVDAWWQRAGVAAEVDSREYHTKVNDQDATTIRHNRLTARYGIHMVHYPPSRIRTQGRAVIAELDEAIRTGLARPPLPIAALPAAA